jgi:hypothetical protein
MKRLTQRDRILRHLDDFGTITPVEAMREYGIMRLAARIEELRKEGYLIEASTETSRNRYGETTRYAKYWRSSAYAMQL